MFAIIPNHTGFRKHSPIDRNQTHKPKTPWRQRIKGWLKARLSRYPKLYASIKKVRGAAKWNARRLKWKFAGNFQSNYQLANSVNAFWVPPQRIIFNAMKEFDYATYQGKVIGGNWDLLINKFEDLDIYDAFERVFFRGQKWADTLFYQRILGRLKKGEIIWECSTEEDFLRMCQGMELWYEEVKEEGCRSQEERPHWVKDCDLLDLEHEVTVSIGRWGDMLFCNGARQLAIAKILNISEIPIKIAVRHPGWIELKKDLYLHAKDEGGVLYQPAIHPDLSEIPAFHSCKDRFLLIKNHMVTKRGKLLDIGANLGYFCHKFEDESFQCFAVENSEKELYFLRKIKRAENKNFAIIPESILETAYIKGQKFEVVLALNIFHHFLKTEETYTGLVNLLQGLSTDEVFFEPHLTNEPQMKGAYKNYSPDEFAGFLLRHLRLTHAERIGLVSDGRPLYHLF